MGDEMVVDDDEGGRRVVSGDVVVVVATVVALGAPPRFRFTRWTTPPGADTETLASEWPAEPLPAAGPKPRTAPRLVLDRVSGEAMRTAAGAFMDDRRRGITNTSRSCTRQRSDTSISA